MSRTSQHANARWPFVLCVVLQTVIFGAGNAVTKLAYGSITPFWCLTIRFGLAALVFAVFFGPRIVAQLRRVRLGVWLPASVCMAVSYIACNVALDLTTATTVGFLTALPVVFAPILASAVFRTRYPKAFLPFQAMVVVGLYLLCSNGGALSFGAGEALSLVSAAALAGALVFGQRCLAELDAVGVAGTQIGMAFALSAACALLFEEPVDVAAVAPTAWGVIAFLAIMSTCLAFFLQNAALEKLPSTTVSLLLTGEPIFTAAFSFALLGETLSSLGVVGASLIVVAVVASTYVEGRSSAEGAAAERVVVERVVVASDAASQAPAAAVRADGAALAAGIALVGGAVDTRRHAHAAADGAPAQSSAAAVAVPSGKRAA